MEEEKLRVNGLRLRGTIEELARIGGTPGGGMHRLALSDEDRRARDQLLTWLREMDLEIAIDEMGNIFGKRKGKDPHLPVVLSGSHLDTQPLGGRFDGILGVTGALEVLRTLEEKGRSGDLSGAPDLYANMRLQYEALCGIAQGILRKAA